MKAHIWSIKLAMAMGLLLASVALAGPHASPLAVSDSDPLPSESDDAIGAPIQLKSTSPTPLRDEPSNRSDTDRSDGLIEDAFPSAIETPEYWIGVSCGPLPPVLYEHLDIPRDQGVPVLAVVPGAPAAKAGIQVNDILLSANKKPLHTVADVSRAIQEAQGKAMTFELLRKGKRQTVEVTPEKNPHFQAKDESGAQPGLKSPPYDELDRIYEWFDRQFPGRGVRPPMRLRFMHPGTILPPGAPMHPALPGSMSITIMKKGDQPTEITVQRGKDTWKVDEKSIDQLPADIRPHVERMLQGMVLTSEAVAPRADYLPDWAAPAPPGAQGRPGPSLRDRIEERIERMNQQLEELQRRIEGLRENKGPEEKK